MSLLAGALWGALPPLPAAAQDSMVDVLDCALRNLPPAGHAVAKLISRARANAPERAIQFEYWSLQAQPGVRRIAIARKGSPANEVSAYLFEEGNAIGEVWEYREAKGHAERVRLTGANARLFGTNFSLEDFARTARVVFPGQVRKLPDATVGGRSAYVVETRPAPESKSEYERLVTSIDKERCLVLRREGFDEQFEGGARPRKVYEVAPQGVAFDGAYAVATHARLADREDGSETRLEVEAFDLPKNLDPGTFTPEALARLGR